MAHKFLRDDGWFQFPTPADVTTTGTATSTGFLNFITKSTTADIASSGSTATYTDGPSVSQGSSGVWQVSGVLGVTGAAGAGTNNFVKLWDGTNVIASAGFNLPTGVFGSLALSGCIANPAGNLRLSILCATTTRSVTMSFNATGNSADCTITAIRIG